MRGEPNAEGLGQVRSEKGDGKAAASQVPENRTSDLQEAADEVEMWESLRVWGEKRGLCLQSWEAR